MKPPTLILALGFLAGVTATHLIGQSQPAAANAANPAAGRAGGGGFGGRGVSSEGDPTPGFGRPMIDLYAAGVAGSRARGGTSLFDDFETTAMTRFEEGMEKELATVRKARSDLQAVSFELPVDAANIAAKAQALADAELALALKRANAFPALRQQLRLSSPERMQNFLQQLH